MTMMETTFTQFLIETILKTKKGSPIKRSVWGVGKDIGGYVYLHKMYIDIIPQDRQEVVYKGLNIVEEFLGHPFQYNTIKISKDTNVVSFVEAADFDTAPEPTTGDYILVKTDTGQTKLGSGKTIWHHKWLWVLDDYPGFDVQESIDRSEEWLQHDVDFSRIGNKQYWDEHHASKLK